MRESGGSAWPPLKAPGGAVDLIQGTQLPQSLRLTGEFDPDDWHRLQQEALACLASGGDVAVDCSALTYLDLGTLQLLLALHASLAKKQQQMYLMEIGDPLRKWLRIAGVPETLYAA